LRQILRLMRVLANKLVNCPFHCTMKLDLWHALPEANPNRV
jgi:hypothetical protein